VGFKAGNRTVTEKGKGSLQRKPPKQRGGDVWRGRQRGTGKKKADINKKRRKWLEGNALLAHVGKKKGGGGTGNGGSIFHERGTPRGYPGNIETNRGNITHVWGDRRKMEPKANNTLQIGARFPSLAEKLKKGGGTV